MCAKPADPAIRTALVETAAHIIANEGLGKLTLRRLASAVGTSTMAVYTHFGGMAELRREVRREGFARLGAELAAVEETDDSVADYLLLGWAYYLTGTTNPDLYRAMFLDGPIDDDDLETGLETFAHCVDGIERCTEEGRFDPGDAAERATLVWGLMHGLVSLQLARLLDADHAVRTLTDAAMSLFSAWGDDADALSQSMATAQDRIRLAATPPSD